MSPMDVPRSARSLGGPEGRPDLDGRARKPEELLERLRQRLAELPDNHPSAARSPARADRARASPDRMDSPESRADSPESSRQSDEAGWGRQESGWRESGWQESDWQESDWQESDRSASVEWPAPPEGPDGFDGSERPGAEERAEPQADDLDRADGTSDGLTDDGGEAQGTESREAESQEAEDAQAAEDAQGAQDAQEADEAIAKDARGPQREPSARDGDPADLDIGLPGRAEVYRPWFMSGEQASPWFAVGPGS